MCPVNGEPVVDRFVEGNSTMSNETNDMDELAAEPARSTGKRRGLTIGLAGGLLAGTAAGLVFGVPGLSNAASDSNSVSSAAVVQQTDPTPPAGAPADADRPGRRRTWERTCVSSSSRSSTTTRSTPTRPTPSSHSSSPAVPSGAAGGGPGGMGRLGGHRGGFGHGLADASKAVTDVLGIDAQELMTQLRDGSTLAEIATANGVDPQKVIDALVAEAKTHLDQAVTDGRIDQAEADQKLADATTRITDRVNNGRPDRGGPDRDADDAPAGATNRGSHDHDRLITSSRSRAPGDDWCPTPIVTGGRSVWAVICVDLAGVGMAQPDKVLFEDVAVTVSTGDRVAVVGVNGSGKTTLLKIMTGVLEPDEGDVRFGRGVRIASLEQDPVLPAGTVREFLGDSWEVAAVATKLGVQPLLDRPTDELSGGQAKRVALAQDARRRRARRPRHGRARRADQPSRPRSDRVARIAAREDDVGARARHPRPPCARPVDHRGRAEQGRRARRRPVFRPPAAAGSSAYATYLDARAERIDREAQEESTRKILARKELAWLRRGAPARSTKPKARLRSANEIVSGGPAPVGRARERAAARWRHGPARQPGGRTRRRGATLQRRRARRADRVRGRRPADRAGCPTGGRRPERFGQVDAARHHRRVGPNLLPGTVKRGKTVVVGFADQHSSDLDPNAVVRELVAGPHREPDHRDRALLERFWFDTTAQYAPVRMLSGGERRRLQLVMVLATEPNLLILDEPTNDLDLDTLRSLEAFLDDWPGALVVASHDRAFLDRVADHVLAIDPGGSVRRVPGGVSGWLAERSSGAAPKSTRGRPPRPGSGGRRRKAKGGAEPVHARSPTPRDRAGDGEGPEAGRSAHRAARRAHRPHRVARARLRSGRPPRPNSTNSSHAGSNSPNSRAADPLAAPERSREQLLVLTEQFVHEMAVERAVVSEVGGDHVGGAAAHAQELVAPRGAVDVLHLLGLVGVLAVRGRFEGPGLALVRPVLGEEGVRLLPPGDRGVVVALHVEVVAELEAGRGPAVIG